MIGNDIVDLVLAQQQSNWQRKGFLDKIFTKEEQLLIFESQKPTIMVWNLWSRKEAAYKIYNRQTQKRVFNPIELVCEDTDLEIGKVICKGVVYFVKSEITDHYIYTEAVLDKLDFGRIQSVTNQSKIEKTNGIPHLFDTTSITSKPISITHHGRFKRTIMFSY